MEPKYKYIIPSVVFAFCLSYAATKCGYVVGGQGTLEVRCAPCVCTKQDEQPSTKRCDAASLGALEVESICIDFAKEKAKGLYESLRPERPK